MSERSIVDALNNLSKSGGGGGGVAGKIFAFVVTVLIIVGIVALIIYLMRKGLNELEWEDSKVWYAVYDDSTAPTRYKCVNSEEDRDLELADDWKSGLVYEARDESEWPDNWSRDKEIAYQKQRCMDENQFDGYNCIDGTCVPGKGTLLNDSTHTFFTTDALCKAGCTSQGYITVGSDCVGHDKCYFGGNTQGFKVNETGMTMDPCWKDSNCMFSGFRTDKYCAGSTYGCTKEELDNEECYQDQSECMAVWGFKDSRDINGCAWEKRVDGSTYHNSIDDCCTANCVSPNYCPLVCPQNISIVVSRQRSSITAAILYEDAGTRDDLPANHESNAWAGENASSYYINPQELLRLENKLNDDLRWSRVYPDPEGTKNASEYSRDMTYLNQKISRRTCTHYLGFLHRAYRYILQYSPTTSFGKDASENISDAVKAKVQSWYTDLYYNWAMSNNIELLYAGISVPAGDFVNAQENVESMVRAHCNVSPSTVLKIGHYCYWMCKMYDRLTYVIHTTPVQWKSDDNVRTAYTQYYNA